MKQGFVDYYQVLEVAAFAPEAEIKAAWRRLAKLHHPDRNPDDPDAAGRFERIHSAYRVLVDPSKRRLYDEGYSRHTRRARPVYQDPASAAGSSAANGKARPTRTADTGKPQQDNAETRRSRPRAPRPTPASEPPRARTGGDLHRTIHLPLNRFRGGGTLKVLMDHLERPLILHMPDSVIPGEELIIPGKGRPGSHGGPAGRMILTVEAELPQGVVLQGSDLVIQQQVHALRAVLGGSTRVLHPDGRTLELKLQPGAQSGQRLRMRGLGLPGENEDGDLVIVLTVKEAPIKNAKALKLLEKALKILEQE